MHRGLLFISNSINVMTYATRLINNQNPQVVSIKHLNADSPLKSLASLDILKHSELLERFDMESILAFP